MKVKRHKVKVARRPANPKALASGSGFHTPKKYRQQVRERVIRDDEW